jgi:hypothetical protein
MPPVRKFSGSVPESRPGCVQNSGLHNAHLKKIASVRHRATKNLKEPLVGGSMVSIITLSYIYSRNLNYVFMPNHYLTILLYPLFLGLGVLFFIFGKGVLFFRRACSYLEPRGAAHTRASCIGSLQRTVLELKGFAARGGGHDCTRRSAGGQTRRTHAVRRGFRDGCGRAGSSEEPPAEPQH